MRTALRAIASPTRLEILELVRDDERASGEIAQRTGLTRPATSQHLRIMREAGLVEVRVQGNRRLYRARPESLEELRAYLEGFWGGRLDTLKERAEVLHRSRQRGDEPR
ncbi:MAG: ArsR/SmtB family transcription factor [Actinomycetota bacterium]